MGSFHKAVLTGRTGHLIRLVKGGKDVDERDDCGFTALHVATSKKNKEIALLLIKLGANVHMWTENKWTALHICAQLGEREIAAGLLAKGANLEAVDRDGCVPLHVCASHGTTEVAILLLDNGAKLEVRNKHGWTPLHTSAEKGKLGVAQMLLERGADKEALGKHSWRPMHLCAQENTAGVARALLQMGADVRALADNERSLLHICSQYESTEVAVAAIEGGAGINEKTAGGETALHLCARFGTTRTAVALMENGAAMDIEDSSGDTALHVAIRYGNESLVAELVSRGNTEVVNFHDNCGLTPLHLCAERNAVDMAMVLLKAGANKDGKDGERRTPLHLCAQHNTIATAKVLLEAGADKDAKDRRGQTPLHVCAKHNAADTAKMLVRWGANKDAVRKGERTPLHLCAEYGTVQVAHVLLLHGARTDMLNRNSLTPLHICAERKKKEVLDVLLKYGAKVNAVDGEQRTALHIAAEHDCVEIARRLLEGGARLGLTNEDGDTALLVAVENGCCGVVVEMLRRNPEEIVHRTDPWSRTPLHVAVMLGHESIARALITAGARRDLIDEANKTPADYAEDEQESMMEILATSQTRKPGVIGSLDDITGCMPSPQTPAPDAPSLLQDPASNTAVSRLDALQRNAFHDDEQQPSVSSRTGSCREEGSSWASVSEEDWTPDKPFGSKSRMLRMLRSLTPGDVLADSFIVCTDAIAGKPHIKEARCRSGKKEKVIVKFYWKDDVYNHVQAVHSALHHSHHICRMVERLKTERTGFPPSIVFEKGSKTLREWLMTEEQSPVDKKWCLRQVLLGLKDAHHHGFVHGDLKPSNVVWFGEQGRWKLIDWDGAQKEGAGTVIAMTHAYAAPEMMTSYYKTGVLSLARRSLDLWSVGIIAYEVLTGERFFNNDASLDDIVNPISNEEVVKKLKQMQDATEREALSHFLAIAPNERWSVADALQHDLFSVDHLTAMDIDTNAKPDTRSSDTFPGHHTIVNSSFLYSLNKRSLS